MAPSRPTLPRRRNAERERGTPQSRLLQTTSLSAPSNSSQELVQDQNRVVRRACAWKQNGRSRRGLAILAMLGLRARCPCHQTLCGLAILAMLGLRARCPCQTLCGMAILAMLGLRARCPCHQISRSCFWTTPKCGMRPTKDSRPGIEVIDSGAGCFRFGVYLAFSTSELWGGWSSPIARPTGLCQSRMSCRRSRRPTRRSSGADRDGREDCHARQRNPVWDR